MTLSDQQLLSTLREHVAEALCADCEVFWDRTAKAQGTAILAGRTRYEMPFEGYYVFVDLQPQANWGHPVLHVFVNSDASEVQTIRGDFPPAGIDDPGTYARLSFDSR